MLGLLLPNGHNMAATITKGTTHPDTNVSKNDFYKLVDDATISGIVNAEIKSNAEITDNKLATISTASKVNLSSLVIAGQTAGDILYSEDGVSFKRIPIGIAGQELKSYYTYVFHSHFDGDNGIPTPPYSAETGQTITFVNTAQISKYSQSPITNSTANLYFNGSSYLLAPDAADWAYGTGVFTIDYYFYPTTVSDYLYIGQMIANDNANRIYFLAGDAGGQFFATSGGTSYVNFTWTWTASLNAWHHVAITRLALNNNNLDWAVYLDGVEYTGTNLTKLSGDWNGTVANIGAKLSIGAYDAEGTVSSYFTGYVSNLRIWKGTTVDFTGAMPTTKYIGGNIPSSGNGLLFYGEDFDDAGGTNHTITAGNITIQASKFTDSLKLDGNSDYVTVPDSDDWNFGTGDFTIDFWVKFNALGVYYSIISQWKDITHHINFAKTADEKLTMIFTTNAGGDEGNFVTDDAVITSAGAWYHIAFVRSGSTPYIFVNGISKPVTTTKAFGTLPDLAAVLTIGCYNATIPADYLNGYIDELRITKGSARWTANFTPPTVAYPEELTVKWV